MRFGKTFRILNEETWWLHLQRIYSMLQGQQTTNKHNSFKKCLLK